MAALAGCFYPGLQDRIISYCKKDRSFSSNFEQASQLRNRTIKQLDQLGELSVDNLASKTSEFSNLIGKMHEITKQLLAMDQEISSERCCGRSKDAVVRSVVYGFSGIGAAMGVMSDFAEGMVDKCNIPVSYKLYRAAATFIILPFIYGVEKNIKDREKLRGDIKDTLFSINDKLEGIEIFRDYLEHRKQALELHDGEASPITNDRLADVLADMHNFIISSEVHDPNSAYHKSMIALAESRIKHARAKDVITLKSCPG